MQLRVASFEEIEVELWYLAHALRDLREISTQS